MYKALTQTVDSLQVPFLTVNVKMILQSSKSKEGRDPHFSLEVLLRYGWRDALLKEGTEIYTKE